VSNHELFLDGDVVGADALAPVLPVGASLLRRFALDCEPALWSALQTVIASAPFRHMVTPGGHTMSVAMTNCGAYGWVTDHTGYRYDACDPLTQLAWPPMPDAFLSLAQRAAMQAGYEDFAPDACLINCYEPGARMSLHQDKNERDFSAPIVSVSLGLTATFQFGGMQRSDKVQRFPLWHGDVLVWGGPSRLVFHGVQPLKNGDHPLLGRRRINLTFRHAH
jgi:alkylated DNA repair protein (DNA oxidative demethylase)